MPFSSRGNDFLNRKLFIIILCIVKIRQSLFEKWTIHCSIRKDNIYTEVTRRVDPGVDNYNYINC